MRTIQLLAAFGLTLLFTSMAPIDDPVAKDEEPKEDEKTEEVIEPKASSTWEYLSKKYDADEDGKITPEEYGRDETHFKRLDIDADGFIAKAEIEERDRAARSERGGGRFGGRGGRGGRGAGGRRGPRGEGGERPTRTAAPLEGSEAPDFELLVLSNRADTKDAEAEERAEGAGETVAEKKEKKLKLSSFERERPVALIFGSYT